LLNPYRLLGLFLSPWKDEPTIKGLVRLIENGELDWRPLVYLANLHSCTPLWYVRLKQDNLLQKIPFDLKEYLYNLFLLNVRRNKLLHQMLEELLPAFNNAALDVILLKGAASFCDDLFGNPGARMMIDIDLLVADRQLEDALYILNRLGYQEMPDPGLQPDGLPTDARHHHLPMYAKPGAPAGLEIHFKIAYGQASRALAVETAWQSKRKAILAGNCAAWVLSPTHRLLHNAVHGVVPHGEFIRSEISLLHLTDFAYLTHRYQAEIDWQDWLAAGKKAGLGSQLLAYAEIAHQLMHVPLSPYLRPGRRGGVHARRIILAGKYLAVHRDIYRSSGERLTRLIVLFLVKIYYYITMMPWAWQNVGYVEQGGNIAVRIRYLIRKTFRHAWKRLGRSGS